MILFWQDHEFYPSINSPIFILGSERKAHADSFQTPTFTFAIEHVKQNSLNDSMDNVVVN